MVQTGSLRVSYNLLKVEHPSTPFVKVEGPQMGEVFRAPNMAEGCSSTNPPSKNGQIPHDVFLVVGSMYGQLKRVGFPFVFSHADGSRTPGWFRPFHGNPGRNEWLINRCPRFRGNSYLRPVMNRTVPSGNVGPHTSQPHAGTSPLCPFRGKVPNLFT